MKILGICGSPRRGKNCEKALGIALKAAEERGFETETILLSGKKIGPCISCGHCKKEKMCSQKDDDFNALLETIESADALFLVSPTYMGSLSAQMKAFLDRSVLFRRQGFLLKGKVGAAAAVGGSRNGGQEYALLAMHAAMHVHGMVVVGDANHFGGTLHVPIEEDEFGLKTLRGTVEMLCDTLEMRGG